MSFERKERTSDRQSRRETRIETETKNELRVRGIARREAKTSSRGGMI